MRKGYMAQLEAGLLGDDTTTGVAVVDGDSILEEVAAGNEDVIPDGYTEIDGEMTVTENLTDAIEEEELIIEEVEKPMVALALREGVALNRRAHRRRHLALDAVLCKHGAVVARTRRLVLVFGTVAAVVDAKLARCRHGEECAHLGAAHTAERHVRKTGEVFVVVLIARRPPALVLVLHVEVRSHYVERHHRHQSVRTDSARVADAEVSRSDERVYVLYVVFR